MDRLTTVTYPRHGTLTYTYAANGNQTGKVETSSAVTGTTTTGYCYDHLDRLSALASGSPCTATQAPIRVNAGGSAYTDAQGHRWAADYGYTTGAPTPSATRLPARAIRRSTRPSATPALAARPTATASRWPTASTPSR